MRIGGHQHDFLRAGIARSRRAAECSIRGNSKPRWAFYFTKSQSITCIGIAGIGGNVPAKGDTLRRIEIRHCGECRRIIAHQTGDFCIG